MGKTRFEQFNEIEIDTMDAFFAGRGVVINESDVEIELYNQLGVLWRIIRSHLFGGLPEDEDYYIDESSIECSLDVYEQDLWITPTYSNELEESINFEYFDIVHWLRNNQHGLTESELSSFNRYVARKTLRDVQLSFEDIDKFCKENNTKLTTDECINEIARLFMLDDRRRSETYIEAGLLAFTDDHCGVYLNVGDNQFKLSYTDVVDIVYVETNESGSILNITSYLGDTSDGGGILIIEGKLVTKGSNVESVESVTNLKRKMLLNSRSVQKLYRDNE